MGGSNGGVGGSLRRGWEGRLPERGYLTDREGGRAQSGQPGPELPGGRCRLQEQNQRGWAWCGGSAGSRRGQVDRGLKRLRRRALAYTNDGRSH